MRWIACLLLCMGVFCDSVFAQSVVKGIVRSSSDNRPIESATVMVRGSVSGTPTNTKGEFSVSANMGDQIEISSVGYQSQTITVKNTGSTL